MPTKGMRCVFFKAASKAEASTATKQSSSSRNFSDSFMEEKIAAAEGFIGKWDADASSFASVTSLFYDNRGEALEYLKAVRELHSAMHFFVAQEDSSSHMHALLRAQKLMQTAMKRLEKEFYQILASNRDHLDPESVSTRSSSTTTVLTSARSSVSELDDQLLGASDDDELRAAAGEYSISEVERVSALAMSDLKAIADCMIATGYGKECFSIYRTIRKSIIDEGLYNLGVEALSPSQMARMDWDVLSLKIKSWLNAVKVAVKTLFYGERLLCDHVFSASASIQESCFAAIAADGATTLLGFPQLVARFKKSPEKMFSTLDLYEAIAHLFPDIESIFHFDSTQPVRQQAVDSLIRLGDSVRAMLLDFESLIQKDSSKSPVRGGGVHPLTRYVMNYLGFLSDYTGLLSDIVGDLPAKSTAQLPESYLPNPSSSDGAPASPIAVRMAWLVLVLLCRLDVKAELYKDVSLSYLFLANNLQYVINKVRSSNLRHLLGHHWVSTQAPKVKQYLANYERMGWSRVFDSLTTVKSPAPEAAISQEEAKRLFKNFNAAFEETCRKQASWVVHDQKLREEIKASVSRKLGAVYRDIYEKYSSVFRDEMGVESILRFSPDDLGNYLSDLFRGTAGVSGNSASSSPSSSPSISTPSRWRRLSGNIF